MSLPSLSASTAFISVILLAGLLLYRASIPKPLPAIPFVAESAKRPFGDIPDMVAYASKHEETWAFVRSKCAELKSPTIQLFLRPFGKPWVIITESQEAQDIMARRTREFERSAFFGDLLAASLPHNQVWMETNDQWRANRRLMADTVSPKFLNEVAAPRIYEQFMALVKIWRAKSRLAEGHPWCAASDISLAMFESIFSVAFGGSTGDLEAEHRCVSNMSGLEGVAASDLDSVADFPSLPRSEAFTSLIAVADSSEIPIKSPLGRYHHAFALRFYPYLRKAVHLKDRLIKTKLDQAWLRFGSNQAPGDDIRCATDLIVAKEVTLAKKQDRKAQYDSPFVRDELLGFLIAGHDTTTSTIEWGVKYLTRHQSVQANVRDCLDSAFGRDLPSAEDIAKTKLTYLDAFIEETLRCENAGSATVRCATQDTEILGYFIPKGTDVFMLNAGPSYTAPPFPVDESKRSKTSKQIPSQERWTGGWDPNQLNEFMPERWLVRNDATGEMEFDSHAGPMQTFGGGIRGCFGRKLAYVALRIIFTLIVFNFELEPLPEQLASLKAIDKLTHRPQNVYLRLNEAC